MKNGMPEKLENNKTYHAVVTESQWWTKFARTLKMYVTKHYPGSLPSDLISLSQSAPTIEKRGLI